MVLLNREVIDDIVLSIWVKFTRIFLENTHGTRGMLIEKFSEKSGTTNIRLL